MNFILISPYYPHNFQMFAVRLKERGVNVLGIGSEPYDILGQQLQGALTEYYQVTDMENWENVAKAVAFFYHKYGKIDRIESNNEYWLELDAFLRTEFNIEGLKTDDLRDVKLKSRMKEVFRRAGAPIVKGYRVEDFRDLDRAVRRSRYPVVVKPDSGVGTAGTYRLDNGQDLKKFKETWDQEVPYFVEPFIEHAQLCTYDGFVDAEGNIVFETSFDYSMPTLELLDSKMGVYYVIQKDIDPKLREIGRKVVKEFGHRERFFHVEFFRRPNGTYISLEYNGRLAGGFTIDAYNYAHSIDLYDQYARVVSGLEFEESEFETKYAVAIGRRDDWDFVNSIEEVKAKYGEDVKMTDSVPNAFRDLLGDSFLIVTAEEKDEVKEIIEFVTK